MARLPRVCVGRRVSKDIALGLSLKDRVSFLLLLLRTGSFSKTDPLCLEAYIKRM